MKKWKLPETLSPAARSALADFDPFIHELLLRRGLTTKDQAERYLQPDYERDLFDPFLLKGMDKAVQRILQAMRAQEPIVIFGDYDADGVPGTVVLHSFFREVGYSLIDIYIPDRQIEAHGLNQAAVEKLAAAGTKLIITVDCGITNVAEIARAKELGVEVVVTDHHLPAKKLPKAAAIVDAKQAGETYPDLMLCGCAVAFKLVQALMAKVSHQFPPGWDKWLLDLVAIATISDMVPLQKENRVLAYFGLKVLRRTRRLGLLELFRTAKLKPEHLMEDDISFTLAPRLNAASRMSHANQAFYLLTTTEPEVARDVTRHLEEKNQERKVLVDEIVAKTSVYVDSLPALPSLIVFGDESWPAGGLGLAGNKVKDKYGVTVLLWGAREGIVRGSGRSDGSVNLVELFREAGGTDFFLEAGGHAMAAGFALAREKTGELSKQLTAAYERLDRAPVVEELVIDRELALGEVTFDRYRLLEKLGPFGMGNPKPLFLLRGVTVAAARSFGNGGIHLELSFLLPIGKLLPAIGFFTCPAAEKFDAVNGHIFQGATLEPGARIDLVANLEVSTFRSFPELRLRIVDLRPAGEIQT